jgi:tetratricopeptide (TPR) repeat protein
MSVRGWRSRALACVVAGGLAGLTRPAAGAPPVPDPAVARADSLIRTGRVREAVAVLDRVVADARASGAVERERVALVKRGLTTLYHLRDPSSALRDGVRAESLARAARDTIYWCAALRIQGIARLDFERFAEAVRPLERLEALARACGARDEQGIALSALGFIDLERDRPRRARTRYRAALASLEGTRQRFYWIEARTGLARCYQELQEPDSARAIYLQVVEEARAMRLVTQESHAYNNLGVLEWRWGDPARAAEYWDRAIPLLRRQNARHEMITPSMHRALALLSLGRVDEGARVVESVMDSLWDVAPPSERQTILLQAAQLRRYQGRPREAIAYLDRYFETTDSLSFAVTDVAADRLGLSYIDLGDPAGALDAIRRVRERRPGRGRSAIQIGAGAEIEALLALGRPREALARLRALRPERWPEDAQASTLHAALLELRAWNDLRDREHAAAASRRAQRAWERYRSTSRDPAWREARGRSRTLALALAELALSDSSSTPAARARAAFDAVQPFRARALSERMSGGSAPLPLPRALRADSLQRAVLEPGEVYLEFHAGSERTLLLAFTREQARASWLPASADLAMRAQRLFDLVLPASDGSADSDPAVIARAGRGLGATLFRDVADLVAGSRRVLVSPDGPLCGLPFALLSAPADDGPLLAHAEVAVVPSAAVLAAARSRARALAPRAPASLFALAGSHDGTGNPLRGAAREVDWLEREFERVSAPAVTTLGTITAMRDAMSHADVIHLAAHTMVDEGAPWRSGVSLLPPPRELVLRASDVARMRLPARLTVLAGCRTIGSRLAFGEGPQGIATGFLAAGVPATVATLWQVDDDRTIEFSRLLYARLAAGRPAGAALREAQLEMQRNPKGRHPFVWAAFTLLGDPGARVPLRERRATSAVPDHQGENPRVTDLRSHRQSQ